MVALNRRRSLRVSAELRVEFRHLGRPSESVAQLTRNLSAGGVFVDTTVALELGTLLALDIAPGRGSKTISLKAEVVRVEEDRTSAGSKVTTRVRGMGLRFVQSDPGEMKRLLALAAALRRGESDASEK